MVVLILLLLIASVFVGYLGRNSRLGFWGVLVASIMFTPLLVFVVLILFGQKVGFGSAPKAQDSD
jgi:hypothetical protein